MRQDKLNKRKLEKEQDAALVIVCLGFMAIIIIILIVSCMGDAPDSGKDKKNAAEQEKISTKKSSSKSKSYGVSNAQQKEISRVLQKARLEHIWASEISLWIRNSHGWGKSDILSVGNTLCDRSPARGYVITFWYSLEPRGKIARVKCF